MTSVIDDGDARARWRFEFVVVGVAAIVALASARPYAGSWNDGSRLASVESLVDHRTLAIEESIYVRVPEGAAPYDPSQRPLNREGTKDKLLVDGRYYSDKPMVQSLAMAGVYGVLQSITGLTARDDPARFCYWMTVLSSGIAYVVAGWAVARIAGLVGLGPGASALFTGSFLFATAALPYVRHVNQHIVLLAVASLAALVLLRIGDEPRISWRHIAALCALAGFGYTLDLGAGPPLALCVGGYVLYRTRSWACAVVGLAAMVPPIVLYHVVNVAVGGTWGPANAHPEYLLWSGSPFDAESATGGWKHDSPAGLVGYAFELLIGTRGFLLHNLPVLVLLPAAGFFLRRGTPYRGEIATLFAWAALTWLVYSTGSNNRSGACYSIRWFVPLLAAAYPALGILLRERPHLRADLAVLTLFGSALAGAGWWIGPWMTRMVPGYWVVVAMSLVTWVGWAGYRYRRARAEPAAVSELRRAA